MIERVWRPVKRSPEKAKGSQRQTSPSRPAFLQPGGLEGRGRRRRNSILSRLAEDSADELLLSSLDQEQGLPGPPRDQNQQDCLPRASGTACDGGHQGDQGHLGYQGDQGDQGGPRLLVEHVSQLSEPSCRFCQCPAPHLDCNKINIYSGGTSLLVSFCTFLGLANSLFIANSSNSAFYFKVLPTLNSDVAVGTNLINISSNWSCPSPPLPLPPPDCDEDIAS